MAPEADQDLGLVPAHSSRIRISRVVAGLALVGVVVMGLSVSIGSMTFGGSPSPQAMAATQACRAYYAKGLVATRSITRAPITVHLSGSYATTAEGIIRWRANMPGGGPAPSLVRHLNPATPLSVCYLTSSTRFMGLSSPNPHAAPLQTEILGMEPGGKIFVILYGPAALPFGPPT